MSDPAPTTNKAAPAAGEEMVQETLGQVETDSKKTQASLNKGDCKEVNAHVKSLLTNARKLQNLIQVGKLQETAEPVSALKSEIRVITEQLKKTCAKQAANGATATANATANAKANATAAPEAPAAPVEAAGTATAPQGGGRRRRPRTRKASKTSKRTKRTLRR